MVLDLDMLGIVVESGSFAVVAVCVIDTAAEEVVAGKVAEVVEQALADMSVCYRLEIHNHQSQALVDCHCSMYESNSGVLELASHQVR